MYRDDFSEENFYKEKIIEMVGEIKNLAILIKIYTVVITHYKILKEREQEV